MLKREPGGWTVQRRSAIGTGLTRSDFAAGLEQIERDFQSQPARHVAIMVGLLRLHAENVIWIGLPVFLRPEQNEGGRRLSDLYASVAVRAGASFIPIYDDFLSPEGGQHFIGVGYEMIAAKALAEIKRLEAHKAEAALRPPAAE